jgi:uncharacterized protein YndB with AHSA1/START domain
MEKDVLPSRPAAATAPDRLQKQILLTASRPRVWRALSRAEEFGAWFGAKVSGLFVPGATLRGPITSKGYEHLTLELTVDRVEPERLLSFRWHPGAVDPALDYSSEPTTLVTFELDESSEGTLLTVSESGFDQIPASRRAEAFRMNNEGWGVQLQNIARYLAETST